MAQNNWLDEGSTPVPQPTSAAADTSWLDEQSVTMVSALARLVAIPSYPEPSVKAMPYGPSISRCLAASQSA